MAKKDVEVNLSEVLIHLRDTGAFRAAVMQVAQKKAGGGEIGEIILKREGGELSEEDLKAFCKARYNPAIGARGYSASTTFLSSTDGAGTATGTGTFTQVNLHPGGTFTPGRAAAVPVP